VRPRDGVAAAVEHAGEDDVGRVLGEFGRVPVRIARVPGVADAIERGQDARAVGLGRCGCQAFVHAHNPGMHNSLVQDALMKVAMIGA
jgi:hypothetical protein